MRGLETWLREEPARFPVLLAVLLSLNVLALAVIGGVAGAVVEIPVATAMVLLVAAYLGGRES